MQKFKIISSNIRFDSAEDGHHIWKNRKPILTKIINRFDPDLMGTQEGRKPQILDLRAGLNSLELAQRHRNWIEDRMYPSIFFNPKRVRVKNSGDIWLSETPEVPGSLSFQSKFPRLATWIEGQFVRGKKGFFYINTHLDHLQETTRTKQIKVLISQIPKINSSQKPIIISGDFNDPPQGPVKKLLLDGLSGLYDPWEQLGKEETQSHHKFDGQPFYGQRIDWILVGKEIEALTIELDRYSEGDLYPSDHFPLKGEFKWCH